MLERTALRLGTLALALACAFFSSAPAVAAPAPGGRSAWCGTTRGGATAATLAHLEAAAGRGPRARTSESVAGDVGQIAVLQDEGDLALLKRLMNLQGAGLRFTPAGGGYSVSRIGLPLEADTGEAIALGDDDSRPLPLSFSFPFFGRSYGTVFVNSDGNLTLGQADSESTSRDLGRLVNGPPRIAPLLADLNLEKGGRLSAKDGGDHVTVTWREVPQFDVVDKNTLQVSLWSDGRIDFVYGTDLNSAIEEGVVGIAPGNGQGGFTTVDFANAAAVLGSGALAESFRSEDGLDTVAVARKFYATHPDDYQQIVVFTSRKLIASGVFSYEQTVKNTDAGIGASTRDESSAYGSAGKLESFVDMDAITKYPDDLSQRFLGEDSALSVLAHEVGHRWLAQAKFMDGGLASADLLGRDEVHWSFFMDSDGSFLEGNDIADLGGGSFRTAGASLRYSSLDQYLMGLRDASEVPPVFVVRNPTGTGNTDTGRDPQTGVTFSGTRKDVTIADMVAAMGPRNPAGKPSASAFRQVFVYVAVDGPADAAAIQKVDRIRAAFVDFFTQATQGRGSVDPRLN